MATTPVDAAYAAHQLEHLAAQLASSSRPYSRALSTGVRGHCFDPREGAHPLFAHCADVYDALLAQDAQLERDTREVLVAPVTQLAALDCKAVADLRKQLGKAVAREEALADKVATLQKRERGERLMRAEGELEEARHSRAAMEASLGARSQALANAWKGDVAQAVLAHLQLLRTHFAHVVALLDREAVWIAEQLAREERRRLGGSEAAAPVAGSANGGSQGALLMWSPKVGQWKPRWVSAEDGRVAIFKTWRDGWPHTVRLLSAWSRVELLPNNAKALQLVTSGPSDGDGEAVTTLLEAADEQDARAWYTLIHAQIEAGPRRDSMRLSTGPLPLQSTLFPASLEDAQTLLQHGACAECGGALDARAAGCMQYGLIVCDPCARAFEKSGFRSLMPLMEIDTVSLHLLLATGNAFAASIWESSKEAAAQARPRIDAATDVRVRWIHRKYAERAFVSPLSSSAAPSAMKLLSGAARPDPSSVARAVLCGIAHNTWTGDSVNEVGKPLLHVVIGALGSRADVVLLLCLLNGSSIDQPAPGTLDTPLHAAVRADCVEAARLLLLQGASDKARNVAGETARSLAHGRCVSLFQSAPVAVPRVVPVTAPAGGNEAVDDLDAFLATSGVTAIPELKGGGLSLASYENADLSALSPRNRLDGSSERVDILEARPSRQPLRKTSAQRLTSPPQQDVTVSPRTKKNAGPLERDEQQRALVESAKKDQAKKRRNAAFVRLRDNIKTAVTNNPRPRSDDDERRLSDVSVEESDTSPRVARSKASPRAMARLSASLGKIHPRLSPRDASQEDTAPPSPSVAPERASPLRREGSYTQRPSPPQQPPIGGARRTSLAEAPESPALPAVVVEKPFCERVETLLCLQRDAVIHEEEFAARFRQLCASVSSRCEEGSVERKVATVQELYAHGLLTLTETLSRLNKLLAPSVAQAPPRGERRFVALYSHQAAESDELSFAKGDVVVCVADAEWSQDSWAMVHLLRDPKRAGTVPTNFFAKAADQ